MKAKPTTSLIRTVALATMVFALSSPVLPLSMEEKAKIQATINEISSGLASQRDDSAKIHFLERALARNANVQVGEKVINLGEQVGGSSFEAFLIHLVQSSPEARLRIIALGKLARHGTSSSIQPLLKCAERDPTGPYQTGCIRTRRNARREAYFALAEIGLRLKKDRKRIAESIQKLAVTSEELKDSRIQALYILTGNAELLKLFYNRLASPDPETRIQGVTSFRFLKLKQAPKALVDRLNDQEQPVRSWVALVLGEIGDPATIPVLIETMTNRKLDRNTRSNAIGSLGRMRAKKAKPELEKLLNNESLKIGAAVALSRITGKQHPLVPEGYDWN